MITDRSFGADGSLRYPALDPTMHTTGVQAALHGRAFSATSCWSTAHRGRRPVDRRPYRLRLLNASNARRYGLALDPPPPRDGVRPDRLRRWFARPPVEHASLYIAPAERFDVVVDFARLPGRSPRHPESTASASGRTDA